jgi:hypothetical protein
VGRVTPSTDETDYCATEIEFTSSGISGRVRLEIEFGYSDSQRVFEIATKREDDPEEPTLDTEVSFQEAFTGFASLTARFRALVN